MDQLLLLIALQTKELRNTKYGLIRHGGRSIDTTKVMDTFASNSDTSCSSFNVFELIATLKVLCEFHQPLHTAQLMLFCFL